MASKELEIILRKLENDQELTDEEERIYMKEVIGLSDTEIDRITTIVNNQDSNVFID